MDHYKPVIKYILLKKAEYISNKYSTGGDSMKKNLLSNNMDENIEMISKEIPSNDNVIIRNLTLNKNIPCVLFYIKGLADQEYIENTIIYPLLFKINENLENQIDKTKTIAERYISSYSVTLEYDVGIIANAIFGGQCVILIDKCDKSIICETSKGANRAIESSSMEKSTKGAKDSFIENIDVNITIIQQKLKNKHLKIEGYKLGKDNLNDIALLYIEGIADESVLSNIKTKIASINSKYLPDGGYIIQYIDKHRFSIFPHVKVTEKPEKVVSDILQGKIAIIVNGSPQVVIAPAVFLEFFQAFEDYSNKIFLANFTRILRLICAFIVMSISPLYLCLIQYNTELIPLNLVRTIANSRFGIPLTPFLEITIMELLIEVLREGGLRLPSPIGQTLAIVGGIILSDSAIKAGLVSPTTLVVVAIGVICTFVIPNYEMTLSVRLYKFIFLFAANLLGLLGIILGFHLMLLSIIISDSFGIPYLSPIAPMINGGSDDAIFRGKLPVLNKDSRRIFRIKGEK